MDQTHIQALACQASHLPSPAMYLFILMIMYVWHPRNIPFEPYDLCQAPSSSPPYHRNTHPSLGCMVIRHLQHGIPTFVWENAGQGRERCKRRGVGIGEGLSHTTANISPGKVLAPPVGVAIITTPTIPACVSPRRRRSPGLHTGVYQPWLRAIASHVHQPHVKPTLLFTLMYSVLCALVWCLCRGMYVAVRRQQAVVRALPPPPEFRDRIQDPSLGGKGLTH